VPLPLRSAQRIAAVVLMPMGMSVMTFRGSEKRP
jgi:hypothetical protein